MSLHSLKRDAWHRCLGEPEAPAIHDPATQRAVAAAAILVREFHDHGRLLNPLEAMAIACRDGHSTETLYSIARTTAASTGGNAEIVLQHLEQDWPDFA